MNLESKIDLIKQAVQAIKTAILGKNVMPSGNVSTYAEAIDSIVTPNNQTKTVTTNGTVTYDVGYTGLENVTVNVNQSVQNKTITDNGSYTADSGYVGLGTVSVNVQPDLGTKTITANGTYLASADNLDGYSSVTVNVSNPKFNYIVRSGNAENIEDSNNNILSLSATKIDTFDYIDLYRTYKQDNTVTYVSLGNITEIKKSLEETFFNCSHLTEVDLSSLISISGSGNMLNTFANTPLTSIDLHNVTTLSASNSMRGTFVGCNDLTSVNLSGLTNIKASGVLQDAFQGCTSLTSLSFPSLTSTSFGSYTNQFNYMLLLVTGCTVHFPSNLQSVIGSWTDVIGGFGGTNTVVLFDLPATT